MDVLLVGSDNALGSALQSSFAQWGRHQAIPVTAAASRWRSERQAKKAVRKGRPQAVVDLRIAAMLAAGVCPQPPDVERSHWLAKACEHSDMHYLLLSSDLVYSGLNARPLRETDPADAFTEPGFHVLEIENRVLQAAPSALVLRSGPLFADFDENLLTRTLIRMATQREAVFDDRNVFCPVASEDLARVLAAMLDQLSVGAEAAGIFHYCSGDRSTEYGFAEVVLAAASQYSDCGDIVIRPVDHEPDESAETRVFDCSRLRDSFAIKQVPWRGFTNLMVRRYYERLTQKVQNG